jgi:choline transport protein
LINLGSPTALNDVLSLVLEGLFSSYLMALSLLLYRRLRGEISEAQDTYGIAVANDTAKGIRYTWGPFRLKGALGIANNILAIVYSGIIIFFGFWPPTAQVSTADMNYSVLVLGVVTIGSMVYYFGWAQKWFQGPIVEVEVGAS